MSEIDLVGFLDSISSIPYIVIKTDTPYMTRNFPYNYPVGKDLDVIVNTEDYRSIRSKLLSFTKNNHQFNVRICNKDNGIKTRFETSGRLHYQIDLSYKINEISNSFIKESIKNRVLIERYFVPTIKCELVYRLVDFYKHRKKKHHLSYVEKHANLIDINLLEYIVDKKAQRFAKKLSLNLK